MRQRLLVSPIAIRFLFGPARRHRLAAYEEREIISTEAIGFTPDYPASWHSVNTIEESFVERQYVGDQADPGPVARIMLEHDDTALWPPVWFHLRVGETIRNPDRRGC